MDRLQVSSADGRASVAFDYIAADTGYRVEVEAGQCRGSVETDLSWSRLLAFFDGVAKDWHGWDGARELRALPPRSGYALPTFRLSAQTDGAGHFTLVTEVGRPFLGNDIASEPFDSHVGAVDSLESGAWRIRVVLVLETWQLDELAMQAAELTKNQPQGPY